eukprot:s286_g20.t1
MATAVAPGALQPGPAPVASAIPAVQLLPWKKEEKGDQRSQRGPDSPLFKQLAPSPGHTAPAATARRAAAPSADGARGAHSLALGAMCGLGAYASGMKADRSRSKRGSKVVSQALGSIDQFRIFGPPEDDPFEIETDKVLGVGGQGTVYLCHKRTTPNVKHAVKTIPIWRLLMDPSCDQKIAEIRKETDVLMKIQGHPNICSCLGIVMELIDGGELAGYIKDGQNSLPEDVVKSVTKQTAAGLKFIHDKDVVHRDLKAENVLASRRRFGGSFLCRLSRSEGFL